MKQFLLTLILFIAVHFSYSQMGYTAATAINTAGTYTALGTNGTVIVTPGFDDDNSGVQNIGFSFFYNGTNFTQFVLNTNGFIKLGAIAPAHADIYSALVETAEPNLIYPMNLDLVGGTAPEYRVYTSGSAPNRVCTIQFKNVSDYFPPSTAIAPQFQDMDFQVKLYETSNNIEFVYGSYIAGGAPDAFIGTEAGIKGTDAISSVNVTKASATAWASGVFINGDYTGNLFNIRHSVLPVSGQTFRFVYTPLVNNDAQVANVYTLGKIPVGYGSPHVVTALVKNAGALTITNLAVTLNVTGANTFTNGQTIASLAPGASATVSFSGYSPNNIGSNTVTVSVGADDNNANNSVAFTQAVNGNTFSYADASPVVNSIGFNTGSGLLVSKYYITGTAYVNTVNLFISSTAGNTGNTIYAVVLDAAGTIIGQSANYVIAAGDLGTYKSFNIITPPAISNTSFYAGLAQTANATAYFPLGGQAETPARPGAFYTVLTLAGGVAPTETTALGRLMIEAVVAPAPLPVKFINFSGRIQNNTALLTWLTSNENNGDRFEVEKSPAGSGSWSNIGNVAVLINASQTQNYQFTDPGLSNGKWMYRLKIVDKDGRFTYSPIVILQLTGKSLFVLEQNYPNPVKDVTMIRYELGKDAIVTIELYSMDGKKIMEQQKGKQVKGFYNTPIDAASLALPNGKYIYRMLVQDYATGETSTFKNEMNVIH